MRVLLLLCLAAGLVTGVAGDRVAHADMIATDDDVRIADGYRQGKRTKLRVLTIEWAEVEIATARAFRAMQRAAAAAGVELWILSGFRSHERQTELYQRWRAGWGNRAARPGYSNHQSGRALDLVLDARTLAWLTANARRFGFRRTVKHEPWHWEFTGTRRRRTL